MNPEWSEKAAAEPGGGRADRPPASGSTGIAAIEGVNGGMGICATTSTGPDAEGLGELATSSSSSLQP
ncbi:hypothetical protein LV779_39055 [Streptomyces thinghirensis]|nr:hypothetical protein [Streptomyces thinghirensis]